MRIALTIKSYCRKLVKDLITLDLTYANLTYTLYPELCTQFPLPAVGCQDHYRPYF